MSCRPKSWFGRYALGSVYLSAPEWVISNVGVEVQTLWIVEIQISASNIALHGPTH